MSQYTPFATIHFRETMEVWNDEIRVVCYSSISFSLASIYIVMSTELKPLIRTTIFLVYSKSSLEVGVNIIKC